MKIGKALCLVAILLAVAAGMAYLELRLSSFPAVQGRALSRLGQHFQIVTVPFAMASVFGLAGLAAAKAYRAWQFVLVGVVLSPLALAPWVLAGSSGEGAVALALQAAFLGVPLGVVMSLLFWRISHQPAGPTRHSSGRATPAA